MKKALLIVLVTSAFMLACAMPQLVWPTPAGEQQPMESPPGEVQITFTADPNSIKAGECSTLNWSIQGGEEVHLNGESVGFSGQKQVCPQETTIYSLAVYAGEGPPAPPKAERQLVISVSGGQSPTQSAQPPTSGCPGPPVIVFFTANPGAIISGQSATLSWDVVTKTPQGTVQTVVINPGVGGVEGIDTRVVKPGQTTTYTLTVTGCGGKATKYATVSVSSKPPTPTQTSQPPPPGGGSWGILTADLAVTDLYPDNWPQGRIYVRITNNGPGSPSNIEVQLSCTTGTNPNSGGIPSASGSSGPITISLVPGQTEAFDTGITVDGTKNWYAVTCQVQVQFKDPNPSNDSYSESFPPPP